MPYCRNCGAELKEDERFCLACGLEVAGVEARVERKARRTKGVRIVLLVLGSIALLVAVGLFAGGGAILWVNTSLTDSQGFITTETEQLTTDSHAIVFPHLNLEVGKVVGRWGVWGPSRGDFVTIKVTVSSNDPPKNIFVGIAEASDAVSYLDNVEYDEIMRVSVSSSRSFEIEYLRHTGEATPSDPTTHTFWTLSQHGSGTRALEWSPEAGSYSIVLMNEDGSAGVDLTMEVGAKIPLLSMIGSILLAVGVIPLIIGAIIIYFGIRR